MIVTDELHTSLGIYTMSKFLRLSAAAVAMSAFMVAPAMAATPLTVTYDGSVTGTNSAAAGGFSGSATIVGLTDLEDASDGQFNFSNLTALFQGQTFTLENASGVVGLNTFSIFTNGNLFASFNIGDTSRLATGEAISAIITGGEPFRAIPDTGLLQLTGGTGTIRGDVSVAAAVPEPGTWLLMLVGFGAVGASMRRRRPALRLLQQA